MEDLYPILISGFLVAFVEKQKRCLQYLCSIDLQTRYFLLFPIADRHNTITSLPQNYQHETVNHSQNFVDPVTGAHTQHIKRYWPKIKKTKKKYEGVRRGEVESDAAEAIWRNNCMVKSSIVHLVLSETAFLTNDMYYTTVKKAIVL